jgi:hypothetical protein
MRRGERNTDGGGSRVRLSFTRTRPASIQAAHCHPAFRQQATNRFVFRLQQSGPRAPAISIEPCASASSDSDEHRLTALPRG